MSRREGRDSDSRHHRSRFDREPSPKRVKRDGRTATEQSAKNHNQDSTQHTNRDKKQNDPKSETMSLTKEPDKKINIHREETKNSSENISRSHFQHDERAGQVGRSFRHRDTTEGGWWKDSKDRQSGRTTNRSSNNGSYKVEPDIKKKRPSFRETKIPLETLSHDKPSTQVSKPLEGSERKEDGGKPPVVDHRLERRLSGERDPQRLKFQSRDRYGGGGGGGYRGRGDRFSGRQGGGGGGEKWKHDLYDEANKSPKSKNEEDQIAKVEALLAS